MSLIPEGVTGALFDLDGTLAETEELKARALVHAVEHFGANASTELYKSVMGNSWEVVTRRFFESSKLQVNLNQFDPVFRDYYTRLIQENEVVLASTLRFIKSLKARDFLIGLVSSATPWMIDLVLTKAGIKNQFDVIISSINATFHKPHPESYLLAIERMSLQPKEIIAFEDTEVGFKAADAAGLQVFGRRHLYNEKHNFSLCEKTFTDFSEFLV